MTSQVFLRPDLLPVLLLAPAAWLVIEWIDRGRVRRLARLMGERSSALADERSPARRRVRRVLFSTALLFALVAAAGPLLERADAETGWRGADIAVCLDVSRSMRAADLEPDRLSRAKAEIRALAERAVGDRVGLVVFAGEARRVVPLTEDVRTLARLADVADPTDVRSGGTDLASALEAALDLLKESASERSVIVLLTDGEDLGARGLAAADACRARGVVVHTVGVGTPLGGKIPLASEGGVGFLEDKNGREVVSALDRAGLTQIAERTGGTFVDASEDDEALVGLYDDDILPMAQLAEQTSESQQKANAYQWPLALAFLCWVFAFGLTDRRRT